MYTPTGCTKGKRRQPRDRGYLYVFRGDKIRRARNTVILPERKRKKKLAIDPGAFSRISRKHTPHLARHLVSSPRYIMPPPCPCVGVYIYSRLERTANRGTNQLAEIFDSLARTLFLAPRVCVRA